jgi:predicted GH43/DUF377 family glycosyl hydrolase
MTLSRRQFFGIAGGAAAYSLAPRSLFADPPSAPPPAHPDFTVGEFKRIFDPSIGEKEQWYVNDHTFIRAEDGQWHLFGITHAEPANPLDEKFFVHATAPDLLGPWTKREPMLQADSSKQETLVWAPYVLHHDGTYYMYYCAGGADHSKYQIHLATSKDLFHWERSAANPMVIDGFDARDPMVVRVNGQWIMYYCATDKPQGGDHHTVKCVVSKDLVHWTDPKEVFSSPIGGSFGGPTESPFLVERKGKYYLFMCNGGTVSCYISDSPFHWDIANCVGTITSHAVEIVVTPEGKWYASNCGWGHGGVDLAELTWKD